MSYYSKLETQCDIDKLSYDIKKYSKYLIGIDKCVAKLEKIQIQKEIDRLTLIRDGICYYSNLNKAEPKKI